MCMTRARAEPSPICHMFVIFVSYLAVTMIAYEA